MASRLCFRSITCALIFAPACPKVLPQAMLLAIYILALAALLLHAPAELLDPANQPFLIVIGAIGAWRYGWAAVHFVRAQIYRRVTFPNLRRRASGVVEVPRAPETTAASTSDEAGIAVARSPTNDNEPDWSNGGEHPEMFILVTTFRLRAEITAEVIRSAVAEANRYPGKVTLVAALVEMADQRFIKHIFYAMRPPERVRLLLVRTPSYGKRHSLAVGLNAIARSRPTPGALVTFLDGDTVLTSGTLERCVPFFAAMPDVAALTTDEDAAVEGGLWLRQWFQLRFAQRHLLMCSMGLSRRLLTLTGRMSMFRVTIAIDPSFIQSLSNDSIDHWRIGRIPLLTGDDKSTWYWLLKRGWDMLYVADVQVVTLEEPPDRRFFVASTKQMQRWFGNMLRASGRAIALGPRRIGLFPWWCLIDQRVSMWTPLLMPLSASALAIIVGPIMLYAYLAWVMTTRLVQSLALLTVRRSIGGLYPLLLLYGQLYGALVKTWILFHPYRQGWTRQPLVAPPHGLANGDVGNGSVGAWQVAVSHYTYLLAMLGLLTAVAFFTGVLEPPWPNAVDEFLSRPF